MTTLQTPRHPNAQVSVSATLLCVACVESSLPESTTEMAAAGASAGGTSAEGASAGGAGTAGAPDGGATADDHRIVEVSDLGEVWSGHPVAFALVTVEDHQFAAYYDAERRMTVAARDLDQTTWTRVTLPSTLGWDSHNYVVLAIDELGSVHVSGNMHSVPLVCYRTTVPLDIETLEPVPSMVGTNEQQVTYPEFNVGADGSLVFSYRDGGSGNGNHIFNTYDAEAQTWRRLLDTPLLDGGGANNAYPVGPSKGPDGWWHLVWVWRDTPDASTNHDLSYARSRDLTTWETVGGDALALPITLEASEIVDPVQAGGGMINNNTKVGFDADGRPVIAYHKFDADGNTQLYNARFEDGSWVIHQTSDWDYRWDFGGTGSLVFEIQVEGVVAQPDGTLTQKFYHAHYGGWGAYRLDPETLGALEGIDPPLDYPAALDQPESPTEGMVTRWQRDSGQSPDPDVRYLLRWETLPENRDLPRDTIPPPTLLRLYGVATSGR